MGISVKTLDFIFHILVRKGVEFMNIIYGYKKNSENKIVYVGQTNNLNHRHK